MKAQLTAKRAEKTDVTIDSGIQELPSDKKLPRDYRGTLRFFKSRSSLHPLAHKPYLPN